jgi:cytochrome c oxidase subunit 4
MAEAKLNRLRSPGFYVGSGVLMLLLTLLAFFLVGRHVLSAALVIPILLFLALIQVAMQLWLFMHLESGRRVFQLFFLFGIGVALIVSWAIWYLTLQSA